MGTSKLSVLRDGVRFLLAIVTGVLCYRPEKIFLMGLGASLLMTVVLSVYPIEFYLKNGRVEEWIIYRFMACFLLGSLSLLLLLATALTNQMAYLGSRRPQAEAFWSSLCTGLLRRGGLVAGLRVVFAGRRYIPPLAGHRRAGCDWKGDLALVAPADGRVRPVQRRASAGFRSSVQGRLDLEGATFVELGARPPEPAGVAPAHDPSLTRRSHR